MADVIKCRKGCGTTFANELARALHESMNSCDKFKKKRY